MVPVTNFRIGVDLGGTKIEIIAIDARGEPLVRMRADTPRGDYYATLNGIAELVQRVEDTIGARGTVGVGIPGIESPATGLVKNANSTWLIDKPLSRDLERVLTRPVRLANDANCFAMSEASDGAAAGARTVFGVILGTGVGGGIVIEGRLVVGANAIAGEWGHNAMPWPDDDERPGPECYCGRSGCIETFLSGPALAREFAASRRPQERRLEAREIVRLAGDGDPGAVAALERYELRLGRALASIINVLDPDVIVLGGGLSNIDRLYENVPRLWSRWVFSDHVATKLMKNKHGDSSGVRGAAWLWP